MKCKSNHKCYYILYLCYYYTIFFSESIPNVYDNCNPSPCGANTDCNNGICSCKKGYFGNPYLSCRPECTHNSDCALSLACVNNKCINPCVNLCGRNATCEVSNHIPICSCPLNTIGNAFFSCAHKESKNVNILYFHILYLFTFHI